MTGFIWGLKLGQREFEVVFERFDSILSDSELEIIDLRWGGGDLASWHRVTNESYISKGLEDFEEYSLQIDVFSLAHKAIYRLKFGYLQGFRLLDEGGLLEFWSSKGYDYNTLGSLIKVKYSPWREESIIPFAVTNEYSFLIVTRNECVEVITDDVPKIEFVKNVEIRQGNIFD